MYSIKEAKIYFLGPYKSMHIVPSVICETRIIACAFNSAFSLCLRDNAADVCMYCMQLTRRCIERV
jgi:hypothetical protein